VSLSLLIYFFHNTPQDTSGHPRLLWTRHASVILSMSFGHASVTYGELRTLVCASWLRHFKSPSAPYVATSTLHYHFCKSSTPEPSYLRTCHVSFGKHYHFSRRLRTRL